MIAAEGLFILVLVVIAVMTTKSKKGLTISLSLIGLIALGGLLLFYLFLKSMGPTSVHVSQNGVSTNRDFINGITIEKLEVDSIGDEGYPVKYTRIYTTSCKIRHPRTGPPTPSKRIDFHKPGKYTWDEDTVQVRYIHERFGRKPLTPISKTWWLQKFGDHPTCPLAFERERWYFFNIHDPTVTGIFLYIDKDNHEHQFYLASGVSPI